MSIFARNFACLVSVFIEKQWRPHIKLIYNMRKLLVLFAVVLLASCSEYQKILKSTDYDFKYKKAMEYYEAEEYTRSATLLQELVTVFMGTDKAEEAHYVLANCMFQLRDYTLAAHYYKEFVKKYTGSEHTEEAQYMAAFCAYQLSPKARLDQSESYNALDAFQLFINLYPNSSKVTEATFLMDELREKLVYKSYLNAKLYFNLGTYMGNNYQSAVIAAQNSLDEFPDTKYREELSFLILESKYIQAVNSIEAKKEERLRETMDEYFSFINEFPESAYTNQAVKIHKDTSLLLNSFTN
jgi:outer membrane protein assembly factor BamD